MHRYFGFMILFMTCVCVFVSLTIEQLHSSKSELLQRSSSYSS
jgi:hypothetical protein